MNEIRFLIGDRPYTIAVAPGQEAHIRAMAALVDDKVKSLGRNRSQHDAKNLLFAALFLADELHGIERDRQSSPIIAKNEEQAAIIERLEESLVEAQEEQERLRDLLAHARQTRTDTGGHQALQDSTDLAVRMEELASKLENRADTLEAAA